MNLRLLGAMLLLIPAGLSARAPAPHVLARTAAGDCASLALHLSPGIHPPARTYNLTPPRDAPRTPYTVAVPLDPGLTPVTVSAGSPFSELTDSPYLQTASAEFHASVGSDAVQSWYQTAMVGCGWRTNGSWNGNAGAFPHGISFTRGGQNGPIVDIGFHDRTDGTADVAVAVQAVRLPAPPARARIHGPFAQLRITVDALNPARSIHVTVTSASVISRLVSAIDRIRAAFSVSSVCFGGMRTTGPAWFTLVRANGAQVHAFESGPGVCGGGLAVNGFRWLLDGGAVWTTLLGLAGLK